MEQTATTPPSGLFDLLGMPPEHGSHFAIPEESLDLFSGNLTLRCLDASLPGGPGGCDLKVLRVHNSKLRKDRDVSNHQASLLQEPYSWVGIGWSMHMGRLHVDPTSPDDAPVLELPDGRREGAFPSRANRQILLTKSFLQLRKVNNVYHLRFLDGTEWTFGARRDVQYGTDPARPVDLVTRIVTPFGHEIGIEYFARTANMREISDLRMGRTIRFEVDSEGAERQKLRAVTIGAAFRREYTVDVFQNGGYHRLTSVTAVPRSYSFAYRESGEHAYELIQMTHAFGGTISYDHETCELGYADGKSVVTRVVSRKTVSTGTVAGTFSYRYPQAPAYQDVEATTLVEGPGYTERVTFHGSRGEPWAIGLLKRRAIGDSTESYTWTSHPISDVRWIVFPGTPYRTDLGEIRAPLLRKSEVIRAGDATDTKEYTYGLLADDVGLPTTILQNGGRVRTDLRYAFQDQPALKDRYALSLVKTETVQGPGVAATTTCQYHDNGMLASRSISSGGRTYTATYSNPGVCSSSFWIEEDPPGAQSGKIRRRYDRGVLACIERPGFTEMARTISLAGWIEAETNQHGGVTAFSYDRLGLITGAALPAGLSPIGVTWYPDRVEIVQDNRQVTRYVDQLGRDLGFVEKQAGSDAVLMGHRRTLDIHGRVVSEARGVAKALAGMDELYKYSYGADGQLTRIEEPGRMDGLSRVTRIDHSGTRTTITGARGAVFTYDYHDLPGKVTCVTEPGGHATTLSYDALGRLTDVDQGGGRTHSYRYNALGALTSESHPETGTISYEHNGEGLCTRRVHGAAVVDWAYNTANQLVTVAAAFPTAFGKETETVTFRYDERGRVSSVESSRGHGRSWSFAASGACTEETIAVPGLDLKTIRYGYDGKGALVSIEYPGGRTAHMPSNGLGLPSSLRADTHQLVNDIVYSHGRNVASYRAGNGTTYKATFDAAGRPIRQIVLDASGAALHDVTCSFDATGNISAFASAAPFPALSAQIGYDALGRISGVSYTPGAGRVSQLDYAYDDFGNVLSVTEDGVQKLSFSHDAKNRLLTPKVPYDARGNVLGLKAGGEAYRFTWDDLDRLQSVHRVRDQALVGSYLYDEQGRRIVQAAVPPLPAAKTPARKDAPAAPQRPCSLYSIHSYDGRLLEEYRRYEGEDAAHLLRAYFYLGATLVAEYDATSRSYYHYTTDSVRSTRLVTDEQGQVVFAAAFDPFGRTLIEQSAARRPELLFAGKPYHPLTNLVYFGARYYSEDHHRFLSPDPAVSVALSADHPQRWHRYALCENNPVTLSDPTGANIWVLNDTGSDRVTGMGRLGVVVGQRGGRQFAYYSFDERGLAFRSFTSLEQALGFAALAGYDRYHEYSTTAAQDRKAQAATYSYVFDDFNPLSRSSAHLVTDMLSAAGVWEWVGRSSPNASFALSVGGAHQRLPGVAGPSWLEDAVVSRIRLRSPEPDGQPVGGPSGPVDALRLLWQLLRRVR